VAELKFFWDYMTEHVDRIRRVVELLDRLRVTYALIGGHAVSFHARPRLTVDIDFLVAMQRLSAIEQALPDSGFVVRRRGDVVSAWDQGMNPDSDEPVLDFVPAELSDSQAEALRSAIEVRYQNITLRMVSRPALVALKFLSATSLSRGHLDKMQDVVDIGHTIEKSFTDADLAEARRIVSASNPPAANELSRLIDDLRHGRKITI
jgi:hypothetical protein